MASTYKSIYFSQDRLKALFEIIQPFILEYRQEPTLEQVSLLLQQKGVTDGINNQVIQEIWKVRDNLNAYDDEWLRKTAKGYAEWNNFLVAVNRMHSYMMTTQYDITPETAHEYCQKVKTMFTSDANFTMNDSVGHDFFDIDEHKQSIVETRTTGYKFFDTCLHGGWAKKTFNVVMGPPKVGKSMWLCNLCANSVLNGDDCAYISLEMSVQIVNQRIGSNLLNIKMSEYEAYAADSNKMREKMNALQQKGIFGKLGALIVEEFPTSSATVYDIESFLLNAEKARSREGKPFKFRNVFIDYINIMADARHGNSAETYMKIKGICEDVRAMAQRNDWCVVSLTQTNRNGMNASDLDMTSVAESSGLVATVDSLFGIICTTMMRAESLFYIKALALRNSPNMGDKKRYNFQGDYMRITEDPNEDIIPDAAALPEQYTVGSTDGYGNKISGGSGYRKRNEEISAYVVPAEQKQANVNSTNPNISLGVLENTVNTKNLFPTPEIDANKLFAF